MKKCLTLISFIIVTLIKAQSIDNLVLPEGTTTCAARVLGHVEKTGKGPVAMILIADMGFGWEVYKAFMEQNGKKYTMYAVTLPGSDGTPSPAAPPAATSYGERTWLENAQNGILDLIEKENLKKPVIVGSLMISSWVALNMALHHPEKISKAVVMGAMPYATWPSPKDPTRKTPVSREERTPGIDDFAAPKMFKTMPKEVWDSNIYQAVQFSANVELGRKLYQSVISASQPIMTRYVCEFYTSDVSEYFSQFKTPVLVLIPGFDENYFKEFAKYNDKYYLWKEWDGAKSNSAFRIITVPQARLFVWADQPKIVNQEIGKFVKK